jgi:CAAX prenyl protease-like protein
VSRATSSAVPSSQPFQHRSRASSIAGYCLPIVVFGLGTEIESRLPPAAYPYAYVLKIAGVVLTLAGCWWTLRDVRWSSRVLASAIVVGLLVFLQWVLLDNWTAYPHIGSRAGFNPYASFHHPLSLAAFLFARFTGLVLVVPVMEELFWRGFLIRYLTDREFTAVPIGTFSASAFWLVAGLSGLAHPEWLAAIVASAAYSWLLKRTGSLFATVVAHAVTNAVLGVYVLMSGAWQYW